MVKITNQVFVGSVKPASYLSSHVLEGNITITEGRKGDEIYYHLKGYTFNNGSVVIEKESKKEIGRIYLVGQTNDKEYSHNSDNPPVVFTGLYKLVLTSDVVDGTTIYTYTESQSNNSMSNKDYNVDYYVKEGKDSPKDVLVTPVTIPKKLIEPEVNSFNMMFTNVTYIEGEWDGHKRTGVIWAMADKMLSGTLFELTVPLEHLTIYDTLTVGKIYNAVSQSYTTDKSLVNTYGVYQKDPNTLPFEVVSIDKTTGKIVFKINRDSLPSNKYVIDLGGDIYIRSLKQVYDMVNTNLDGVVTGVIKSSTGTKLSNGVSDTGMLAHIRTKKNTSADVPYRGIDDTPIETKPPTGTVDDKPPVPVEPPSCMDCLGCSDCYCHTADVMTEKTEMQLREKLRVFHDLTCVVMNTHCLDIPKIMGKFVYTIWCFLTDVVNQIVCLYARTNTLKKRDEELCGKSQVITQYYNLMKAQLDMLNKTNLEQYNVDLARYEHEKLMAINNKNDDGYLTQFINKELIMGSEPNATMTTVGKFIPQADINNVPKHPSYGWVDPSYLTYENFPPRTTTTVGEWQQLLMRTGDTVTVTYSNLTKTTYQGKKVDKIVFTYTLQQITGAKSQIVFNAINDPTVTAYVHAYDYGAERESTFKVATKVQVFVEGKEIIPTEQTPFPVTFGSINSINGTGEYVSDFSGEFIPISGSAITARDGKALNYNSEPIENFARRAGSADGSWDTVISKYNWVGAIGGKTTRPISFSFGNTGSAYWFAFNTGVNAGGILFKPIKPHVLTLDELITRCDDLSQFTCGR